MRLHRLIGRPVGVCAALAVGTVLVTAGCGQAQTANPGSAGPTTTSALAAPGSGGAASGPATGGATRPATGPTVCNISTLTVALGPSEGAAGTVYAPLRFTNKGSRPCVMQGFPGVSYLAGDRGGQVGQAAQRDGARGVPVTLQPGGVASATLAMVQVRNYDASVCRPTPVHGLRVYPPNDTASVYVPLADAGTGCAGNPPGPQLRISSVKSGAGPS